MKEKAKRCFDGRKPTIIRTKFPSFKRVCRVMGVNKRRAKEIERMVARIQERDKSREELLVTALSNLKKRELRTLRYIVKSEINSNNLRDNLLFVLDKLLVKK